MRAAKKILYSLDTTRCFIKFRVCLGLRFMQPLKTTGMEAFCDCHSLAEQQNCHPSHPVTSAHDRELFFVQSMKGLRVFRMTNYKKFEPLSR